MYKSSSNKFIKNVIILYGMTQLNVGIGRYMYSILKNNSFRFLFTSDHRYMIYI